MLDPRDPTEPHAVAELLRKPLELKAGLLGERNGAVGIVGRDQEIDVRRCSRRSVDGNGEATDQPVVDAGALEGAGHDEQRVEEVRGHSTRLAVRGEARPRRHGDLEPHEAAGAVQFTRMYVVTGGAGFIGSQLVRDLLAAGERVVVLDDFSSGKRANLQGLEGELEVIETNVVDGLWAGLGKLDPRWGTPTAIVHLAAQVSVVASLQNPLEDARRNHGATLQVLEYARQHRGVRVVLASSAATYGDVDEVPVRESSARWPLSPYGFHKFSSELALRAYATTHGVPTAALRFFNVYGPRQDPSSPYSGVISIFMKRALAGEGITIYGDGEQTRDFVFVSDVSAALRKAASQDFAGDVFNVGTGAETSINVLAQTVVRLAGSSSSIGHAPARSGEVQRSCAELSHARDALGYEPSVGLDEGLAATLAWFR